MKYSFALALLMAVVSVEAIQISAEPVLKKEEPKKDDAALIAKLEDRAVEKKVQDEKAVAAETKAVNDKEADDDRKSKEATSAYDKNMANQAKETKRIEDLRTRPVESMPMEGHSADSGLSKGEHWT